MEVSEKDSECRFSVNWCSKFPVGARNVDIKKRKFSLMFNLRSKGYITVLTVQLVEKEWYVI